MIEPVGRAHDLAPVPERELVRSQKGHSPGAAQAMQSDVWYMAPELS